MEAPQHFQWLPFGGMLLASLFLFPLPNAVAGSNVVYEIFVRSFYDDDNDTRGIGDLQGIIKQLDYLNDGKPNSGQDLGVEILWLMPVFPSPTYHGYDVTDYRAINPDYGTLDDLKTLLTEAHKRRLRIILDIPFNHTSNQHEWFTTALADPQSPYRSYYLFEPKSGDCKGSWYPITTGSGEVLCYFGLFDPSMPDLNFDNPKVRQEVKDIALFLLDLGVDGFRLDAAKHIYGDTFGTLSNEQILKNNDWWLEFSTAVYQKKANAILVGEVLGDPELLRRHAWGLDGLLDQPFMDDLRNDLSSPTQTFVTHYKQWLEGAQQLNQQAYQSSFPFPDQPFQFYPYLASHDRNPRLASDLEYMKTQGKITNVNAEYRVGMYSLLSLGTRPILYAGDEVMQKGWKWNGNPVNDPHNPGDGSGIFDETLREPFPWYRSGAGPGQTRWFKSKFDFPNDGISKQEQEQPGEMVDLLRAVIHLREKHPVLATGAVGSILSDGGGWMVFERTKDQDRYLVLINMTGSQNSYNFHSQWYPEYIGAKEIFLSDGNSKQWTDFSNQNKSILNAVTVPAYGFIVLQKK